MERKDDYPARREHLKNMTEEQLEARFWELAEKLMEPVIELAEKHTTPSVERSVLLRMGFSSLESMALVNQAIDSGLISKGAGHLVYKAASAAGTDIRTAGLKMLQGELWDELKAQFAPEGDR